MLVIVVCCGLHPVFSTKLFDLCICFFYWDSLQLIEDIVFLYYILQKLKFSIKDFFSKCDQIHIFQNMHQTTC